MLLTKNYQMIKQVLLGNTGYGNVYLRNYAKYNSQSIENNTSNVSVQLRIYTEGGYWFQQSGGFWAVGLTDNDVVNGQANQQFNVGETVIATLTGNVNHRDDGSMVCACLGSVDFLEWGWKGTVDEEATLPTIPRATASPNLDGYIESSIAIALNPASANFKHRIYYSYNGKTGYYPSSTGFFANTGSLTLDTSFYNYTPKATGTGTITLYTYNSAGTLIGSKTSTLTVRCDSSKCKPTITATIVDVNETTKALTGDNTKLIKGYSNAQIDYTITPRNGASISNKTVNGSTLGTSPFVLNKVSTSTFNIVATDSRGFSTTLTKTNTLVDYIPLSLSLTAFRPTPTGSVIKVNFEGNYFNQSFGSVQNTLELSWKYKLKESADWIDGGTLVQDTDYKISGNKFYSGSGSSVSDITLNGDFPYDNVYDIAFYYKDKLISNGVQQKTIPKGIPILNWNKDEVDVNGNFKVNGYVKDTLYVEDIKSKNQFNKNNVIVGYFEGNTKILSNDYNRIAFIKCKPNTTYTISKSVGSSVFMIATSEEYPKLGVQTTYLGDDVSTLEATVTTNSTAQYLLCRIAKQVWTGGDDLEGIINSLQIEEGKKSSYVEHIEFGNNERILYENTSGNNGTITLVDNVKNYKEIEIYFKNNDGYINNVKILSSTTLTTLMNSTNSAGTGAIYFKSRNISINGNTIGTASSRTSESAISGTNTCSSNSSNLIYITKVIGYR